MNAVCASGRVAPRAGALLLALAIATAPGCGRVPEPSGRPVTAALRLVRLAGPAAADAGEPAGLGEGVSLGVEVRDSWSPEPVRGRLPRDPGGFPPGRPVEGLTIHRATIPPDQATEVTVQFRRGETFLGAVRVVLQNRAGRLRVSWQPQGAAREAAEDRPRGDAEGAESAASRRRFLLTGGGGRYFAILGANGPRLAG